MRKQIPVKYIDTTVYEGGKIPDTLIHLDGVTYYIESYTSPMPNGLIYMTIKEYVPF